MNPLSDMAAALAEAVEVQRSAERLVLDKAREAERIQEELVREVMEFEPVSVMGGEPPVVAFTKEFRGGGEYSYAAIGIEGNEYDEEDQTAWYLTNARNGSEPMNWAALVKFMGVKGLATLQVLRGE